MLVTLFSDASVCPHTGISAWAAWAKCDRGSTRGDGAFRRRTIDSAVAEAMAVVNGIVMASRDGLIREGDSVLAQTDNNAVMTVLLGTARRGFRDKDVQGPAFREMRDLKRSHQRELELLGSTANDDPLRHERMVLLASDIERIRGDIRTRNRTIDALKAVADRRNEEIREIAATYADLVQRLGITVRWRHCKGHKGLETKRSAVNTGCDERAKARMQDARKEHHRLQVEARRQEEANAYPLAA